jgi:FAD:protein FMN transferase
VAVDRCVAAVAAECGTGVLVGIDSVLATAGLPPAGGWLDAGLRIPTGAAVATASADSARGHRDGHEQDDRLWRTASVLAFSAREARAYSLAALVRGTAAPNWLRSLGVPALLITVDGQRVTIGDWTRVETA